MNYVDRMQKFLMLNLVVKNVTSWTLRDEDLQLPHGNVRGGSRFCGVRNFYNFGGPF